jgi:Co/Zn/Cd efflux system component
MHSHSLENWTHDHNFLGAQHARNEQRTWLVVWLTLGMMVAEIVGGSLFGSMALLADGWHMSTHAVAIGIAALAYRYARRHADNPRFAFGTGKFGELAAFTSAVVLGMVAVMVAYESLLRMADPKPIAYGEAIAIAVLGLAVNLVSAWLLRRITTTTITAMITVMATHTIIPHTIMTMRTPISIATTTCARLMSMYWRMPRHR